MDDDFIESYIKHFQIRLCVLYYAPYSFKRTGCVGCPYERNLQKELDTLEKLLPNERAKAEFIWNPVYTVYREMNYRLKS